MQKGKIDGHHDMKSAAALSGLSPSVIRMWESRYSWPRPRRLANGYRSYTAHEVDLLRRVAAAAKAGTPVGQLIVDGSPVLPSAKPTRSVPAFALMRAIPQPVTTAGAELRREVEAAATVADAGRLRLALLAAVRIAPADRMNAAYAPTFAALSEMPASAALAAVHAELDRALGPGVLEGALATLLTSRKPDVTYETLP